MKKKSMILVISVLTISLSLTLLAVYLYRNMNASDIGNRIIQNATYFAMLFTTFIFIKLSKKPLRKFGLFKENIFKQILIGIIIAVFSLFALFLLGWRPHLKDSILYIVLSQMLVGFTEEMLFRGFVLTMLKDVVKSTNKAVVIAALLFGLWHYPLGQNVGQVITAFIIGGIYGTLRTVFEDSKSEISIISIAVGHWIYNVMI